jgi:hypothetical protein
MKRTSLPLQRREFITLLPGAAATSIAGSMLLRAQPQPRMLRVGFVGIQPRESPLYGASIFFVDPQAWLITLQSRDEHQRRRRVRDHRSALSASHIWCLKSSNSSSQL